MTTAKNDLQWIQLDMDLCSLPLQGRGDRFEPGRVHQLNPAESHENSHFPATSITPTLPDRSAPIRTNSDGFDQKRSERAGNERRQPWGGPAYVTRVCKECGDAFTRLAKHAVRPGRGLFCSRGCATAHKNHKNKGVPSGRVRRGESNPNWKGGISRNHVHYKNLYRSRHPERALAHDELKRALRLGKLIPGPCAHCGSTVRIHGHHTDYTKPLEVTWLCKPCHIQEHVRLSRERAA